MVKKATPTALLVVEDDPSVIYMYSMVLEHFGYQITTATGADEAFACATLKAYDLAIVDVKLPQDSGIDVAKRLRDEWGVYSLFISAYDDERTVTDAVASGGIGYLVKPVDPTSLVPAINAAVARAKEMRKMAVQTATLRLALNTSRVISMAIGALMASEGITEEQAFEHLRKLARGQRKKVEEIAKQLVGTLPTKPDER